MARTRKVPLAANRSVKADAAKDAWVEKYGPDDPLSQAIEKARAANRVADEAKARLLALRPQLEAQEAKLAAELAEVRGRLAYFDELEGRGKVQYATVADAVRAVLLRHPNGMTAVEAIREVQAVFPGAEPRTIHATLRHAHKVGTRRAIRYSLTPSKGARG